MNLLPKLTEIAVAAGRTDEVVETILAHAKPGEICYGKIFVSSIDHAVRIRTSETDDAAL